MINKCPVCGKRLRFNLFLQQYECPRRKCGKEKRLGCGYVNRNYQLRLI